MSTSPLPSGLVWRGDVLHIETSISGRRVSRSCRTSSVPEAKRLLETIRGQSRVAELTGIEAPVHQRHTALVEFVQGVVAQLRLDGASPRTLTKYTGIMQVFSAFMRKRQGRGAWVDEVTHEAMHAFKQQAASTQRHRNGCGGIGRPASARTVANELDVIRVFLRKAVQQRLLKENPEAGVGRPRGAYDARIRWLDDEQIVRLLTAARTWDTWAHHRGQLVGELYAVVIEFYLRTGLRLNELRYLILPHCQSREPSGRRLLHIGPHLGHTTFCCSATQAEAEQLRTTGDDKLPRTLLAPEISADACRGLIHLPDLQMAVIPASCAWKPKSHARDVPLSVRAEELFTQLLRLRKDLLARDPAILAARTAARASEPPWLVPDPSGSPWRFSMQYVMDRCSHQAGISPIVRTHDLRHTFATQLRRRGVAIETIKELLGHADISETLIYAHFTLTEAVRYIDLIDQVAIRS